MQLLKNPSFEEGTPKNWQTWQTGNKQIYTYPEQGRTKGSSVAIEYKTRETGMTAAFIQTVNIGSVQKYELSGWIKTQNIVGDGACLKVDWKDEAGNYLSSSTIMPKQKGTIQWTYFEGYIIPNKNAKMATILLSLEDCSGKAWFDDILLQDVIQSSHPNMYINIGEINMIKENVKSNIEPWKTAYNKMISDANAALSIPVQSVTFKGKIPPSGDKHDYWTDFPYTSDGIIDPNADRTDYNAAQKMDAAVRNSALGYAFTGNLTYADKALQLIRAWTIDPKTKMNPKFTNNQSRIEISITIPGMFYGADLIWNYSGWTDSDRSEFKTWTSKLVNSAKSWIEHNNYENWRLVLISSGSVIIEDLVNLQYAFDRWKAIISDQMNKNGSMKYEITRTTSLSYSLYAVKAMITTAELARHNGTDLYNYKLPDGRGLELTMDFHAPYAVNPSSWPYQQIKPYKGDNAELYELAYAYKQKLTYISVINKWGRPMYDERILGNVTLTHGK